MKDYVCGINNDSSNFLRCSEMIESHRHVKMGVLNPLVSGCQSSQPGRKCKKASIKSLISPGCFEIRKKTIYDSHCRKPCHFSAIVV